MSKDRLVAWLGVFVSPVLLLVATVLRIPVPTIVAWLLVGAFLGGFGYLVAQMPRGPRDPFDDGARLCSAVRSRHKSRFDRRAGESATCDPYGRSTLPVRRLLASQVQVSPAGRGIRHP